MALNHRIRNAVRLKMKNIIRSSFVAISTCAALSAHAQDPSEVERHVVSRDNVDIEVLSQGPGPVIVLLPSLGRSGEDYDSVAAILAADGFRVLRPQPRGIGRSKGPMDGLNMHDLATDVARVIENENKDRSLLSGTPSAILSPGKSRPTGLIWCEAS
jgi:hypothetical protein